MHIDPEDFIKEFCDELAIDPDGVAMESKLEEIPEWDSLGMVRFLLVCDEKYGVQLPATEASQATTMDDLKQKVEANA